MRRRRKQKRVDNHQNLERWLLTYADMITLLTAFFLMLYSMSSVSKGKFSAMASSVRKEFSSQAQTGATSESAAAKQAAEAAKAYDDALKNLGRYVEQHDLTGKVTTWEDSRGTVISLVSDGTLFSRGKAEFGGQGEHLLGLITPILKNAPNAIEIEGHTCNLPIHTAQFPSNWELSTARAGAVLRYFSERRHMPNSRFSAAGYAETHPLVPNINETNRQKNRRVDIVLLKTPEQVEAENLRSTELKRIMASDEAAPAHPANLPTGAPAKAPSTAAGSGNSNTGNTNAGNATASPENSAVRVQDDTGPGGPAVAEP